MISCDDIRSRLGEYFDGECPSPWRENISAHLSTCAECQADLAALTRITQHVFAERSRQTPPFLWTRVQAAIEAEEARRGTLWAPWWAQWRWMTRLTVTAALLVGVGSAYLLHQTKPPLESILQGRAPQQSAIQVASTRWVSPDQTAMQLVLGDESWAQN